MVWEQTGVMPEELENPEPSPAVSYLFIIFQALSLSRQSGMASNPILYTEIEAWSRLNHIAFSAWEIDVLKQLDILYLNAQCQES